MSQDIAGYRRICERLESTSNDKLEGVLKSLLPKLLPMLNKQTDNEVITVLKDIVNIITNRILNYPIQLPLKELIELIKGPIEEYNESSLVAIDFVNIAFKQNINIDKKAIIGSLLSNLSTLPVFCLQSYALCYYLHLVHSELAQYCIDNNIYNTDNKESDKESNVTKIISLHIYGDYILDVCFIQDINLVKGAVGSVLQGTSYIHYVYFILYICVHLLQCCTSCNYIRAIFTYYHTALYMF